jgi:hypothetical protein
MKQHTKAVGENTAEFGTDVEIGLESLKHYLWYGMVTLLRGVTEFETYILTKSPLHSELREVVLVGRYCQYRLCRVHGEPGGKQMVF